VPVARLATKDDRKAMLDFPVECRPPQPWDSDTRAAAVYYAKRDNNATTRRVLFIHRARIAIALAVTADEPIPGGAQPDVPACYLAVMAILPGYRGAMLEDGRRLSHLVLDTQIEDGRTWGHRVLHTIVHAENRRMRALLDARGFEVFEDTGDGWLRLVAQY
jgi:hypothetical protein